MALLIPRLQQLKVSLDTTIGVYLDKQSSVPHHLLHLYSAVISILREVDGSYSRLEEENNDFDRDKISLLGEIKEAVCQTASVADLNTEIVVLLRELLDRANTKSITYVFQQPTAVETWAINHGLNRFPNITTVDPAGKRIYGEETYIDENNLVVSFTPAQSGILYLN
jgi:hypothetical protein